MKKLESSALKVQIQTEMLEIFKKSNTIPGKFENVFHSLFLIITHSVKNKLSAGLTIRGNYIDMMISVQGKPGEMKIEYLKPIEINILHL